MTTRARTARSWWVRFFLAAIVAVLTIGLATETASAASATTAENRVRASSPAGPASCRASVTQMPRSAAREELVVVTTRGGFLFAYVNGNPINYSDPDGHMRAPDNEGGNCDAKCQAWIKANDAPAPTPSTGSGGGGCSWDPSSWFSSSCVQQAQSVMNVVTSVTNPVALLASSSGRQFVLDQAKSTGNMLLGGTEGLMGGLDWAGNGGHLSDYDRWLFGDANKRTGHIGPALGNTATSCVMGRGAGNGMLACDKIVTLGGLFAANLFTDTESEAPAETGLLTDLAGSARAATEDLPAMTIDDAQFGAKIGKHAADYGLNPADPAARSFMRDLIMGIRRNADEVRIGPWNPKGGGGEDYLFFRQGSDVVVTQPGGPFVTLLKGGENNGWFQGATPQ